MSIQARAAEQKLNIEATLMPSKAPWKPKKGPRTTRLSAAIDV